MKLTCEQLDDRVLKRLKTKRLANDVQEGDKLVAIVRNNDIPKGAQVTVSEVGRDGRTITVWYKDRNWTARASDFSKNGQPLRG